MVVSSFGFLTFGENSSGFILDNYSYRDNLATVSRLGVAFSVIFAYPLLFLGGRDGWLSLMGLPPDGSPTVRRMTCILLLTIVTILAILLNDLTFVLSFSGATLSASIIYILPPMMFSSLVLNCTCLHTFRTNTEIKESKAMIVIGSVLGVSGASVTVVRTFFS
jgi:amino acid permease